MSVDPTASQEEGAARPEEPVDERPEFTDRIGSVVGGYLLEEVVGSGGMGVVYRARQGDTGRVVALKLMLPEVASNRKFRERFILEAQVAPQLEHPHIVPVFEVGDSRGRLFIAMRLVEGLDLKEIIERDGALDPRRTLRIIRQAAAALDYAHEQGMIHRDVKPQNLLLAKTDNNDEHVYLTDFGLVKPTSTESTASRTSDVFGSIQYMSPEQIEGMAIDGRADVYSLACVAFECLTAQPPFERANEIALLWAHVHEEPPRPTDVLRSLPGGLDLVLRQALSKHPDDRYLTCGEFVDALEEGAKQHRRQLVAPAMRPLVQRIPRPKTEREVWAPNFFPEVSRIRKLTDRTNWVQVTAVTTILILLAAGFVHFSHQGGITGALEDAAKTVLEGGGDLIEALSPEEEEGSEAEDASSGRSAKVDEEAPPRSGRGEPGVSEEGHRGPGRAPLLAGTGPAGSAAPLARGGLIAFASNRSGSYDIWTADPSGGGLRQLTQGGGVDLHPAISPDGSLIVFSRSPSLRVSCVTVLGNRHCVNNTAHLWVMRSDGSGLTQLTSGTDTFDSEPDWAPDGETLVFTRWEGTRNPQVYLLELTGDGGVRVLVGSPHQGEMEPSFSPDGRRVVYTTFDDNDNEWEAQDDHSTELSIAELSVGTGEMTVLAVSESDLGRGYESAPAWSPDGRAIVLARSSGLWLWECPSVGCGRDQVFHGRFLTRGADWYPAWSPDGTQLAFQRCRTEAACRIVTMNLQRERFRSLIDAVQAFDGLVDWGVAESA